MRRSASAIRDHPHAEYMSPDPAKWRDRWAEGLTIVVSILLALLADAAWGYRNDRVEERVLLAGLVAEFEEAASEIGNDIAAREELLRDTQTLLDARSGAGAVPEVGAVPGILTSLVNWRFYTPVHAVLDDALASGRLDLIRSRAVRESLMTYLQARGRIPVFDQLERDFATLRMETYLGTRVPLDRIADEGSRTNPDGGAARRFLDLLTDDEFGSLLSVRLDRTEQALIYSREVARAVDRVREALGAAG